MWATVSRYLGSMKGSRRSEWVTARAPGKVNLSFRVGEQQGDGSQVIATLYQAVSLFDTVTATLSDDFTLSMLGDQHEVPGGARNLAMRAAQLLARATGVQAGVHLEIDKQIPRGSGMSGGSADAAAALVACNELWGLGLERAQLKHLALDLGADVPFALEGGTAVGTGHGDEFTQAICVGSYDWVIVPSADRLEQDAVVERLVAHRAEHREQLGETPAMPRVDTETLQAIRSGCTAVLADSMHNDLQMASLQLSADARRHLELGETEGALAGITLGTTPAIALLVDSQRSAEELRTRYARVGVRAIPVRGPVAGAQVVDQGVTIPQAVR